MAYYTAGSLQPRVSNLLQGRTLPDASFIIYLQDTVLELSEDYKFPGLQTTGPVVTLTPLVPNYSPNFFMSAGDQNLELNKVDSFFMFTNGYTPISSPTQQNTGFQLRFATINDIEVLLNIPGLPTKWTRHENEVWLGSMPDQPYQCQMRYIHENGFPLNSDLDLVFFPNSWKDILSYCIAMRAARDLNLSSKASELFNALYGSSKFIISGGQEGTPGLIFQRTSQERRDQTTTTKSMRLKIGMQR